MEHFKRTDRVRELIRLEISNILRDEVNDPRLALLSITRVEVSTDLKHAQIYVSPLKEEEVAEIYKCLKNARGFIQKRLGLRVKLRFTPVIEFHIDDSIKYGLHIMEILESLKKEKENDQE
ncbi:30S ribosome-binding factor RbfA [bacterium]|nr:30S ribosome-binding factor RbfA [bacterium]